MTFKYPLFLFGGVVLVALWLFLYVLKNRSIPFGFGYLLQSSWLEKSLGVMRTLLIILCIVLSSIILARPQIPFDDDSVKKEGIDIVIAMDISYSMEANDFQPTRLVAAKKVVQGFVEQLETDRIGLTVFAGKPFVSVPLTFDYDIVYDVLERTTVDTINQNVRGMQGTAVGDALLASLTILEKGLDDVSDGETREQIVILLTDGEANTGVDPEVVAQLAAERGIKVYTVGIGSLEGGIISFDTAFGVRSQQIPGVDEETLKSISSTTRAKYWRATDEDTFRKIFSEITKLEKTIVSADTTTIWKDLGGGLKRLLLIICVLFLLEQLIYPVYDSLDIVDSGTGSVYSIRGVFGVRLLLLVAMFIAVVLSLFNVQLFGGSEDAQGAGYEFMILLDVSTSMEVEDIAYGSLGKQRNSSTSRLIASKTLVERLLLEYQSSKVGLGVFAGESIGMIPITSDIATVMSFLGSADARSVTKQGTNINDALMMAADRYAKNDNAQQTIILITDGGEEPLVIDETTRNAILDSGLSVVVVLVGTPQGGPIPLGVDPFGVQSFKQFEGKIVQSKVDASLIQKGVKQIGGELLEIQSIDEIKNTIIEIGKGKRSTVSGIKTDASTRGVRWSVGLGLFFFLWYLSTYIDWRLLSRRKTS